MSLLLDIFVIAVFAICLYSGIKKGFIRSIMGIAILVVAIVGSIKLTPPLADHLNERYLETVVTDQVIGALDGLIGDVEGIQISNLFAERPQAFVDILERFGVDFDDVKQYFEINLQGKAGSEKEVAEYIAKPLSLAVSKAVAFTILFIGLMIVLTVILMLVDLFVKLPILNGANKVLGGIFGTILGLALAWGVSNVMCALLPHLAVLYDNVSETMIENTYLVKFLGGLDIFHLLG
ncbi:MAG: CvpA family protein [Clostridia bacterium]|nr:CvpA family protein [Clostridia bacterium]